MADLLCAACVRATYEPTAPMTGIAQADVGTGKRREIRPGEVGAGWDDVRFAGQSVGWYAVTMIQGTAVCWAHAMSLSNRGNLISLWGREHG